jgi:HEPN domain-containing protein/predicted nucleotidyltransferase
MIDLKDHSATQELQEVVKRVVGRFHPDKIILYGSFAYGTPNENSDFDLLVILSNPPSRSDGWKAANEIGINHMLQLVFMKPVEFEETKNVVGGLAYPAHHWGKIVYLCSPESIGLPPPESMFRTREQVIWDLTQGWLKKAENRLRMTEICLRNEMDDYFYAGFYSQQSAENFVRAILVRRQVPYHKSHEIQKLLDLFPVEDDSLAHDLSEADWLTPFGVDFPDPASPPLDMETGRKAVEEAKRVQKLVMFYLGDYLIKGRPEKPIEVV